jgi:serine/threonine-protein kinase
MDKIGPYQILETLHSGPQPLYRAKGADGREVALKVVPVAALTPETRERFIREAETCRGLNHPNVIRVYDSGEANDVMYQAMELLDGADLGKVIADGRQFTWDEKLSIMEQVCEGLQYAHEHNLVHRDIKPANLFLEKTGHVRVLDFGMVRVAESQLTKVGSSLGTLNYMSPEQIRGERCTAATDVFSAGIVFFQLATGRHPFSARDRSLPQVVSAIVFETPPKLSEICPDAPEGLEFILNKALEKDPAKRLQNAGDLKQALALCRITLKLGIPSTATAASAAPARPATEPIPSAAPESQDPEKTRIIRRQAPIAPALERPAPTATEKPLSPAPPPSSAPPRPPAAAPQYRYCPACTAPNPPDSPICRQCGTPFAAKLAEVPAAAPRKSWALTVAITLAALLFLILILVLMMK